MKKRSKGASSRKAWTELSKDIRRRIPYCQKCGRKADEARLQVHHILPRRLYPKLLLDRSLLLVLCPRCHNFCRGSAHKDGVAFAVWLERAFPDVWKRLRDYLDESSNL